MIIDRAASLEAGPHAPLGVDRLPLTSNDALPFGPNQQCVVHDTVGRVVWCHPLKRVVLKESGYVLDIPRSACISKGDPVVVLGDSAWVACANGMSRLLPVYVARERLRVGALDFEFVVKEITEPEELQACEALAQFHYRGRTLFGRTARLIIRSFHPIYPKVVGFIELTSPFYMNKARAVLLDAPFSMDGIDWTAWDKPTMRQYIHLIVRVARCVVYPEFRGLGLGQLLLRHAADFARDRWQMALLKPLFLEISADMLKFVPFAESAGMVFVGDTQGNLARVAKDMTYLIQNHERIQAREIVKEEASGIVDKQVWRMNRALALMESEGWSLDELVGRLERMSGVASLRDFALFHELITLPKPTYLQGLTENAHRFVVDRSANLKPQRNENASTPVFEPLSDSVHLRGVSVSYHSKVRRTSQTHAVQQAFGISPEGITHDVVRDLTLTLGPGDVVLLTGPSGSGKTTVLELLAKRNHVCFTGEVSLPEEFRPGVFAPIRSGKALIEVLGPRDVSAALHLMGLVGLSDVYVYLKRFDELSNGQQYRAMLAQLIASNANLWLADEFAANLDLVTANVVADRLQRLARRLQAVLVVASSQPETFAAALRPDRVVVMTTAWQHSVMPGKEFLKSLSNHHHSFRAPTLSISSDYLPAIREGRKTTTIRLGRKDFGKGLLLTTRTEAESVTVTGVRHTRFSSLSESDAHRDGFATLDELMSSLYRHYPSIGPSSWVTIVSFEPLACGVRRPVTGSN